MLELILLLVGGITDDKIAFTMDLWVEPEFQGKYIIVDLIVVNFDIPEMAGYYSQKYGSIVIEEKSLNPTVVMPSGRCYNNLWHEIKHVAWQSGSEHEDHMRMIREGCCC